MSRGCQSCTSPPALPFSREHPAQKYESGILLWLISPGCAFDLESLETLHFAVLSRLDARLFGLMKTLFETVFPPLKSFSWSLPGPAHDVDEWLIPLKRASSRLENVSKLTIAVEDYSPASSVPWIPDFLQHLPHPDKLREVIIPVTFQRWVYLEDIRESWDHLGILFSSQTSLSFSSLRRLHIGLWVRVGGENTEKDIRKFLSFTFCDLDEKGILKITRSECPGYIYARDC
ncbi:hypothetical protein BDN72DRAFT_100343 [Pluteus cervinus]|uniref:Uncharacterized protein n=1 Tax=Pluteus cervinus TaxID=181527 RepID=A0ACD3B8D3_9AGAR|nr:hypothetical protein BDN72DRAFT_100343 [Pluteus cervinus]